MPDSAGERLETERVYEGRLLRVDRERVRTPAGVEIELELVRHPGASAVVPLLSPDAEDPDVLLIHQYRYAAGGMVWEIPAGVLEPGEDPLACARRELLEETGATASRIDHLTSILTTPGFTDEQIHLFVATGISVGTTAHEADELIDVRRHSMTRALEMIRDGEIVDGKSIAALLYVAGFRLNL